MELIQYMIVIEFFMYHSLVVIKRRSYAMEKRTIYLNKYFVAFLKQVGSLLLSFFILLFVYF